MREGQPKDESLGKWVLWGNVRRGVAQVGEARIKMGLASSSWRASQCFKEIAGVLHEALLVAETAGHRNHRQKHQRNQTPENSQAVRNSHASLFVALCSVCSREPCPPFLHPLPTLLKCDQLPHKRQGPHSTATLSPQCPWPIGHLSIFNPRFS